MQTWLAYHENIDFPSNMRMSLLHEEYNASRIMRLSLHAVLCEFLGAVIAGGFAAYVIFLACKLVTCFLQLHMCTLNVYLSAAVFLRRASLRASDFLSLLQGVMHKECFIRKYGIMRQNRGTKTFVTKSFCVLL